MKDINGLNTKYYYDPLSAKLKQVSFEDKNEMFKMKNLVMMNLDA